MNKGGSSLSLKYIAKRIAVTTRVLSIKKSKNINELSVSSNSALFKALVVIRCHVNRVIEF